MAFIRKLFIGDKMEISASESVKLGAVMASIKIKVEDPALITAAITRESAEELELAIGDEVKAIIKSTEVMVAK